MKDFVKDTLCAFYKYCGAMHAQERLRYWSGRRYVSILLFHRVTDEIPEDGLTVSTNWFDDLCAILNTRFHVISLDRVHQMLQRQEPFPRRTVAITFDDCYRDNLFAARVLARHGLPATFFIPSSFVGTDHVFEWDKGLKKLENLGWDDVREMAALGHAFGSHSVSHADFGQIDVSQARWELAESKRVIESQLRQPIRWFAFPYGGKDNFKREYLPLARELGYDGVFSGYGGVVEPCMVDQMLPREPVPFFRSHLNLELHLSGCLDWYYRFKRRLMFSVG